MAAKQQRLFSIRAERAALEREAAEEARRQADAAQAGPPSL